MRRRRKYRLAGEPEFDEAGRRIRLRHPPELLAAIAERQGDACAICGLPMGVIPADASDRRPAMWLATHEHVVRFADGGADDASNIVAAHRICNEKREGSYRPPSTASASVANVPR